MSLNSYEEDALRAERILGLYDQLYRAMAGRNGGVVTPGGVEGGETLTHMRTLVWIGLKAHNSPLWKQPTRGGTQYGLVRAEMPSRHWETLKVMEERIRLLIAGDWESVEIWASHQMDP